MKIYYKIIITGILSLPVPAFSDLFFSEYIEGSSYNKALEIYNPSDVAIDLSEYSINLFSNGNSTANSTFTLSGTLKSNAVYVVANKRANSEILSMTNETSSTVNFNGNDTVTLTKKGVVLDVIGQIGHNPGSKWGMKGLSTKNNTIRRKSSVTMGNSQPYSVFNLAEWEGFKNDTFSGLGWSK